MQGVVVILLVASCWASCDGQVSNAGGSGDVSRRVTLQKLGSNASLDEHDGLVHSSGVGTRLLPAFFKCLNQLKDTRLPSLWPSILSLY